MGFRVDLSMGEAAKVLDISIDTLRRWDVPATAGHA
jgi:hypothetical protein